MSDILSFSSKDKREIQTVHFLFEKICLVSFHMLDCIHTAGYCDTNLMIFFVK